LQISLAQAPWLRLAIRPAALSIPAPGHFQNTLWAAGVGRAFAGRAARLAGFAARAAGGFQTGLRGMLVVRDLSAESREPGEPGCQLVNTKELTIPRGWRRQPVKPMLASIEIVLAVLVTLNLIGLTIAAYYLLRRK
jgi:hypothetical protein